MTALSAPLLSATVVGVPQGAVVSLEALHGAVSALTRALPGEDAAAKSTPVLGHVLVRCFPAALELVASDLDTVAGAIVPRRDAQVPRLEVASPPVWTQLVPGRLLSELLTRMDGVEGETVTLEPTAPQVLRLTTRDGKASLVGADPVTYPLASPFEDPPAAGSRFAVAPAVLATLIDQTAGVAAADRALDHPLLATLKLTAPQWQESGDVGNGLYLEGADGHRLARAGYSMLASRHEDPRLEQGVLVPAKALRLVRALLRRPASEDAGVGLQLLPPTGEANLLEVTLPRGEDGVSALVLRIRLVQGAYPDWSQYYRRTVDCAGVVDAAALLYHVRQCAVFAPTSGTTRGLDYAPLSLTLDPKAPPGVALRLASKSTGGEHRAWLPATVSAKGLVDKPVTVGLSVGFLQAVLQTAPGKRLEIGLETGLLPVHVTPGEAEADELRNDYHCILMPIGGPHVAPDPGPPPAGEGGGGGEGSGESGLGDHHE